MWVGEIASSFWFRHSPKRKRDFIAPTPRDGAEVSLHRPTLSQERKGRKKSACSVRNEGAGGQTLASPSEAEEGEALAGESELDMDGAGIDGEPGGGGEEL